MKKIWQIFEYEKYDILVTRNYNEKSHYYTVDFSFCPEVGNTTTVSLNYDDQSNADKAFFAQTVETAANFAKHIIEIVCGECIQICEPERDNDIDVEEKRKDFCLWYYAQSQPLDANKVFEYFNSHSA